MNPMEDPYVSKKLAARLRASYGRVYQARDKLAYVEAKSRDVLLELRTFDADPQRYAALNYPNAPDPDAYPTVTRIGRLRSWVQDKAGKIPVYHEELLAAEADMEKTVAEVLTTLQNMRPTTPRPEPWPSRPQSLDELRKHWELEYAKNRSESAQYMKERQERRKRDAALREEERLAFIVEMRESVRAKAAAMSPGAAAAYLSMMEVLQERLLGESITFVDIHEIAQGNSTKMHAMIAEAQERAIARLSGDQ
jgi:hypothetical protein